MRTFTRTIPVTAAIEWLENGRTNLYAVVDTNQAMAVKVGKLETMEKHLKSKGRNKPWRLMSYQDVKAFHLGMSPTPPAAPAAMNGKVNGHAPAVKPSPVPVDPMPQPANPVTLPKLVQTPTETLTKISEELIESIVNERIKEALELQQGRGEPVSQQALTLIKEVRQLERHGMSVLKSLEQFGKHDATWSKVGMIGFQQATMAMVKSLTA